MLKILYRDADVNRQNRKRGVMREREVENSRNRKRSMLYSSCILTI